MNINIVGLNLAGFSVGDELAAFDGNICVGALKITESHLSSGNASLISSYSTDELIQNGFKEGDAIQIYSWNKLSGNESIVSVEALSGQMNYSKNGSVLITMKSVSTGFNSLSDDFKIDVFPNPSQGHFTVRYSELPEAGSKVDVLDISGRKIVSRLITGTNEEFDLYQLTPGLYLVKSAIGPNEITHKLIISK
jgi:hypothetical protein